MNEYDLICNIPISNFTFQTSILYLCKLFSKSSQD